MNKFYTIVFALTLMLCMAIPAQAAVDWDEGFEYANSAAMFSSGNWNNTPCTPTQHDGQLGVSSDRFHSGTKSLKYIYTGEVTGQVGTTCWMDRHYSGKTELWTREWVFLDTFAAAMTVPTKHAFNGGYSETDTNPDPLINSGDGGYPNSWTGFNNYTSNTFGVGWQGAGAADAPQYGGTIPSSRWVCIETHYKMNTPNVADGLFASWVDGVARHNNVNLLLRRSSMTINGVVYNTSTADFRFTRLYRQHGYGILYMDDYAIGSTRIGCGDIPPQDTTAPSVPTGLAVNGNVITWNASTDAGTPTSGVASYDVFRCGPTPCTNMAAIANVDGTSYTDTSQVAGQSYAYTVRANDGAGNSSQQTAQVTLGAAATTFRDVALFTDNFNRADSTELGANFDAGYTVPTHTNARIVSNQVRATTTSTSEPKSIETVNSVSLPNNQWCKLTLPAWSGTQDNEFGCLLRAAAPTTVNWYMFYARKTATNAPARNSAIVSQHINKVGDTNLASDSTTVWGPGDQLIAEAEGTTLRLKRIAAGTTTEVTLLTATDSEYTAGRCGLALWMATGGTLSNSSMDDFSCGGFSAGTSASITVDAVTSSATTNTTNTISWTHTIGSCTNRVLAVSTQARDDASAADTFVTGVTYGGAPLTKIRHDRITDTGFNLGSELWYLANPQGPSGSVIVTWAGALSRVGTGSAVSLCGVDQTSPLDAQAGSTGTSGTTISSAITTVANNSVIVDTFMSRPSGGSMVVGAGQTSQVNRLVGATVDVGMSTVLNKTPAGAETMDWTRASTGAWTHSTASFKPATVTPVVAPTIASLSADTTGLTVTAGATAPTTIRIVRGDNAGNFSFDTLVNWSDLSSGRYTKVGGWEAGLDYLGVRPFDAAGIENTALGANKFINNSTGWSPPMRTTPPALSNALPATVLPFGTTSATISYQMDVGSDCRYDTSDVAYSSMANQMTVTSLTASATVTGLTNGSTTTYYGRCNYINAALDEYPNTSSIVITVQVQGAATDTTLPSTVSDMVCTVDGSCVWTAATDNVAIRGYQIKLSTDACATFYFVASPTVPSYIFPVLTSGQAYCAVVRAEDTTGNLSAADSNQYSFTTLPVPDVQPPSDMANLRQCGIFTATVFLCFDVPTDDHGVVASIIQACQGADCVDFANTFTTSFGDTVRAVSLVPNTVNRFRGFHSDGTNNSTNFSNIVDVTTVATGLGGARPALQYGTSRHAPGASSPIPPARPVRPY